MDFKKKLNNILIEGIQNLPDEDHFLNIDWNHPMIFRFLKRHDNSKAATNHIDSLMVSGENEDMNDELLERYLDMFDIRRY